VQPTLRQSTQCWPFNHNTFSPPNESAALSANSRGVRALARRWEQWAGISLLRLRWVESQSVLFDARFLRWFYETSIVQRVLELQQVYHVSWGTDALWCGAAMEYNRLVRPSARAACAVVTVPIDHDNTKSIGARGGEYIKHGFRLLEHAGITSKRCLGGSRVPSASCAAHVHKWWSPFANQVCAQLRPSSPAAMAIVQRCASIRLEGCASGHRRRGAEFGHLTRSSSPAEPVEPDTCDELQPLFDKQATPQLAA